MGTWGGCQSPYGLGSLEKKTKEKTPSVEETDGAVAVQDNIASLPPRGHVMNTQLSGLRRERCTNGGESWQTP